MVPGGVRTRKRNAGAATSATQGCNRARSGLLIGIALRKSVPLGEAQRYRRCTSWRDSIPGILLTAAASTHAMVLETPSQHLESQHPSRPSMFGIQNVVLREFVFN